MRIAEKTIELNFCAQANSVSRKKLIWFGLTQRQEAKLGFDACTKLNGRLFVLQFKASNHILKSGARRFSAAHAQMVRLQNICKASRSVFYVFPLVGTTLELAMNPGLLSVSWLLDASALPNPMPQPTTTAGILRRSKIHYVDVVPGRATIHSEPREVQLLRASSLVSEGFTDFDGVTGWVENSFEQFWEFRNLFTRNAVGVVVMDEDVGWVDQLVNPPSS